jgi:hypothetical protein
MKTYGTGYVMTKLKSKIKILGIEIFLDRRRKRRVKVPVRV